MKTIINSYKNSIIELAKRSIYSFQVLIVGIAIPVLFLIGTSTHSQKLKEVDGKVINFSATKNLSASVIEVPFAKI